MACVHHRHHLAHLPQRAHTVQFLVHLHHAGSGGVGGRLLLRHGAGKGVDAVGQGVALGLKSEARMQW